MRKVVYKNIDDKTKKIMLYQVKSGVYLFGYDCLQDTSANWDHFFATIADADEFCKEEYNIAEEDWIIISDPLKDCQHDFIIPTMIKGGEFRKPEFGHLKSLIEGKWIDYKLDRCLSFDGLTGNEKLLISGLLFEFENAKLNDKKKAIKILTVLNFDECTINNMAKNY